jgi:dynein heavy chain
MTSAMMSYCGPFPAGKRNTFKDALLKKVRTSKIPYSKDYSFASFMAKPIEFLNWGFKGLPDDLFSKENAVLVMKGPRFPIMIDP